MTADTAPKDRRDVLLNRMFEDIKQILTNKYYTELFMDKQNCYARIRNAIIALSSVSGASLSPLTELAPVLACAVSGIMVLMSHYFSIFARDPQDVTKLIELRRYYEICQNDFENLYGKFHFNDIDINTAEKKYKSLYTRYADKNSLLSSILGKVNKKLNNIAIAKSETYLNRIYYGK